MKKILILNCSPRNNGNTVKLLRLFERNASANSEIHWVHASGENLAPCRGCYSCMKHQGVCDLSDDMTFIRREIEWADMLVFGSPLYQFGISAQMKIVLDRMLALMSWRGFSIEPKEIVLIMSGGSQNPGAFDAAWQQMKSLREMGKGWNVRGCFFVGNANAGIGDALETDVLNFTRNILERDGVYQVAKNA